MAFREEKKETLGILIQKEHLESRVHSISLIYHFVFHYINQAAMNISVKKNCNVFIEYIKL